MEDFRNKVEDIYEDDLLDRIPFAEALYTNNYKMLYISTKVI